MYRYYRFLPLQLLNTKDVYRRNDLYTKLVIYLQTAEDFCRTKHIQEMAGVEGNADGNTGVRAMQEHSSVAERLGADQEAENGSGG